MGALPSRESNEDPSSVFFANCDSHIVFHIPMTDHYFPSPHSLAFRQLFYARNNQSALYCFDMKEVSSVMPEDAAEAFRVAQEVDWGAEVDEADPSLHYYDDEIHEKVLEYGSVALPRSPRFGQHLRPSVEDIEELYRVLVTEPMEGTLVDTDSQMCALLEQEQRWRAALPHLSKGQQQDSSSKRRCETSGGHGAVDNSGDDSSQSATGTSAMQQRDQERTVKRSPGAGVEAAATHSPLVAESATSSAMPPPSPPAKFLYPLPRAIALRMTTEEEEEMRAEYCRKHFIPYVAPAFHDVRSTGIGICADGSSFQQQRVAPLPVVERRHYHFEDDPQYRDGRVHLVEEHGVLYHFAYFAKRQPQTATAVATPDSQEGEAAAGSVAPSTVLAAGTTPISQTPIVRGRCLHDMVYSEKPPMSPAFPASSSRHAGASSSTFAGCEPELAPPVRYGWCARCGEQATQRLDYTHLCRLKSTRALRRAARGRHTDSGLDLPEEKDDMDEVTSNTEQVDEEGEEEFIINIMPVRVVGLDGLLPSRSRGTPWLRGYEQEDEAAEDAYIEQLEPKPPVMRVCRFIEGSVGDKIVNRAALVTLLSYRPMCRQAGLRDALTRPIWSMCVLSNIPYLQMVRETFFRAKAAVAEVDDGDLLLRNWLDVVDRENNFYNFINANLYMTRNFTPPERTVRQREQTDEVTSTGTAMSRRTTTGTCGGREGGSVCTGPAGSSSATSPLLLKTAVYSAVGGSSSPPESRSVHSATSLNGAATAISRHGQPSTVCAAADLSRLSTSPPAPQSSDEGAEAAVAARESVDRAGLMTDAPRQGMSDKRKDKRGHLKLVEGDGAELRSLHLTRALEEVTIGRPEGHGPRDQVEEDEDDEDGTDEEGGERDASEDVGENNAAAKIAAEREKSKKLQHRNLEVSSSFCSASSSPPAPSTAQNAASATASLTSARAGDTSKTRGEAWCSPVATSVMGGPSATVDNHYSGHQHRSGGSDDGGESSGESSATFSNAAPGRVASGQGNDKEAEAMGPSVDSDDDDPDVRMEEEENRRAHAAVADTAVASGSLLKKATAAAAQAVEASSAGKQQEVQQQLHRPEVPPRPNFQLFSSRLEPHAPLSLCTLFDYDASADQVAKRTVTQLAAAVAAGVAADKSNCVGSRGEGGVDQAAATCADAAATTTGWPSYVQRDILRENERWQAEPKATRRPSHALYECGMLATTRGRNFLFLLREDCVRALLYYCSAAAAPIFIGAYIEPVDTTSVSYGGAVRLRRPSTVDIPLDEGGDGKDGIRAAPARNYDGQRVVIGQVEGMEVMAECFKSSGLITCFNVSDVDKAAPGPSAAHRLRKMILPQTSSCTSNTHHYSRNDGLAEEADSLATQQARELAQYGHVFTYAADDFCDGDLVVFNFEEHRWEHYEHMQLRRRFAAKATAAAAAATVEAAMASAVPGETAEPTAAGNVAVAADGSLSCANAVVDPSMSARLLCVGLDELVLSWTKWIVDNRFYEDRTDLGWLSLPDGSPIQLGGRYFLWSFRHNHQRYFYGVIPKFAKGRLRRQKLMERNRNKRKKAEAPRQQAQPLVATSTTSSARARQSSDVCVASSALSSPVLAIAAAAAATPSPVRSSCKSAWPTSDTPVAQSEGALRRASDGTGSGNLHADPYPGGQASSPPQHPDLAVKPSSRTITTQKHPQTQPPAAATLEPMLPIHCASSLYTDSVSCSVPDANTAPPAHNARRGRDTGTNAAAGRSDSCGRSPTASLTTGAFAYSRSSPQQQSMLLRASTKATTGSQTQQGHFASSRSPAGCFLVCDSNVAQPTLYSTNVTELLATPVHLAPFLNPPLQQSASGKCNHISTPSSSGACNSGQQSAFGGGRYYYYQCGGNTFIQGGKRHENEYYPPLPTSTPFHPVTAITKLVPLPHPQRERGGIPAIFRFWGPIGSPPPRTPVTASLPSNAGGVGDAVATAPWAAIPISQIPQMIRPLSPRHAVMGSRAASSSIACPTTTPAIVPTTTAAAAGSPTGNLTLRVRRRITSGSTSVTSAINVGSGASVAPLQPPSHCAASLGPSLTTLTATETNMKSSRPFTLSPLAPPNFPGTLLFAQSAPTPLLDEASSPRRLSPTSMLPTNLINEGSKTKGESVLRVDEDTYMQRKAFRWNPYASTKWRQNNSSAGSGTTCTYGSAPTGGRSGSR
ncbi:hypothetical protein MNV84_00990 [Leishmania braziliensis]|nr:hypothetical protein MNV84_00990 [Leishmania braziliensis]